jgi:hypothetical protein
MIMGSSLFLLSHRRVRALRATIWKFFLGVRTLDVKEYFDLIDKGMNQNHAESILNDAKRTFAGRLDGKASDGPKDGSVTSSEERTAQVARMMSCFYYELDARGPFLVSPFLPLLLFLCRDVEEILLRLHFPLSHICLGGVFVQGVNAFAGIFLQVEDIIFSLPLSFSLPLLLFSFLMRINSPSYLGDV